MGIDTPNIDNISHELNTPLAEEIFEVSTCDNPDFQAQFDELVSESREKTCTLLEDILSERHKEILINIYSQLGENNPELKQAIENQTIRIFDVPERELVALYEDGGNLLYFANNHGEEYFNLERVRNGILGGGLEIGYNRLSGVEQRIINGRYLLFKGENEIQLNSEEYIIIVLRSADLIMQFQKDITEEIITREKEGF